MSARTCDSRCWETGQKHKAAKRAIQEQISDRGMLQRAAAANLSGPSGVPTLQHIVGNRATTRLLQANSSVGSAGAGIQRKTDPSACTYDPGERAQSRKAQGILDTKIAFAGFLETIPEFAAHDGSDEVVVTDFEIGSGELRPGTKSLLTQWVKTYNPTDPLEFIGFTDCVGMDGSNASLRQKRAQAVADLFPSSGNKVIATAPFPGYPSGGRFLAVNASPVGRALNRSVIIRHPKAAKPAPAPTPKPPHRPDDPSVITKEEPASNSCSADQREQLSIAFPAAKKMAETALSAISGGKPYGSNVVEFLLKRHFGKDAYSHLPEIRAGFSKILANWKNWEVNFDCEVQTEGSCPNDDPHMVTLAYVKTKRHIFSADQSYGTVHVCGEAFKNKSNMQNLSTVILHELSHRLDNTDDKKYCGFNGEGKCESLSAEAAIDNADSYAQFAHEYFNTSIQ